MSPCRIVTLPPLLPYANVLALQRRIVEERQHGAGVDTVILCEHPPVYTLGVGASMDDVGAAGEVPVVRVGRGGGVTYHGPGQLVGYPILRLHDYGWRVSDYLCALERTLIATVRAFGVDAHCEGPTRGIYVEDRKLASIGIQVSRGIAWHGFALNVSCDLAPFTRITPCRQPNAQMTSLAQELKWPITVPQVQQEFISVWLDVHRGRSGGSIRYASAASRGGDAARPAVPLLRA